MTDESGGFIDWMFTPRVHLTTGSEAWLVYPAGDADRVTITALRSYEDVEVRTPDGKVRRVVAEDIGIGVDDDITATFDDGTTWPPVEPWGDLPDDTVDDPTGVSDHAHSGPCGECQTWGLQA